MTKPETPTPAGFIRVHAAHDTGELAEDLWIRARSITAITEGTMGTHNAAGEPVTALCSEVVIGPDNMFSVRETRAEIAALIAEAEQ